MSIPYADSSWSSLWHIASPLFPTAESCCSHLGSRLMGWPPLGTLPFTVARDGECPGLTAEYSSPEVILHTTHLLARGRHVESHRQIWWTASMTPAALTYWICHAFIMFIICLPVCNVCSTRAEVFGWFTDVHPQYPELCLAKEILSKQLDEWMSTCCQF